jgi:hypothetical protein
MSENVSWRQGDGKEDKVQLSPSQNCLFQVECGTCARDSQRQGLSDSLGIRVNSLHNATAFTLEQQSQNQLSVSTKSSPS